MAYVAANTSKISLGTSVIDMFFYTPVMLAKSYATLDVLSQGRAISGLGLGWSKDEYQASNIPFARGERADEFLQVMKTIWTNDVVEFKGKYSSVAQIIYPGLQGYDIPGMTLAIPSNTLQKIVPKLISQHSYKHPWLGVDVTDLSNFVVVNHRYGAVVEDVDPDGPAAKIGIEGLEPNMSSIGDPFIIHDILTAINGLPIKNSSDFYNYINNKSVGDRVVLTTMHDGVTRNFTFTLGEMLSPL